jgi:hypothetical protein
MRTFFAPYKIVISSDFEQNILSFLSKLKEKYYIDHDEKVILEVDDFKNDKNVIWGFCGYGSFGNEKSVIDTVLLRFTKTIQRSESPLDKYFFLILLSHDRKDGYLILQRRGNVGIRSIFDDAINDRVKSADVKIQPIVIGYQDIIQKPIKQITISLPEFPKEIEGRLKQSLGIENFKELTKEIVIKAERNQKIISSFMEDLKKHFSNKTESKIGIILHEGESLRIKIQQGKSERTVYLNKGKFRSWYEIPNEINVNSMDALKSEALKFIASIKQELEDTRRV